MRVLVIGNYSDKRCGFQNFSVQTEIALRRAGVDVVGWDGTYSTVKGLSDHGLDGFFPADVADYDVVHVIWNALTLNHYSGADWSKVKGKISWWDGGPSDASCPFIDHMQIRWSDYPREGYHYLDYPVPDWVPDLPEPADTFTVGSSSVRGDGVLLLKDICERHGWGMNFSAPGQWLPLETEIRRLALSTVNVCWYNTPPLWHNRASAPSMMLASLRPLVINDDPLVAHLTGRPDIYHVQVRGGDNDASQRLELQLERIAADRHSGIGLKRPIPTAHALSWSNAVARLIDVWGLSGGAR